MADHSTSQTAAARLSPLPAGKHGLDNRGLEAGAMPGVGYGRFGRMFPFSGRMLSDACLQAIATAMIKIDAAKPIGVPEPVDENPAIPAGYTYFGQFIDHDLTLDPTPLGAEAADVAALEDFRTPAFDLDCIYGRGPDDQPYLYASDGLHLRLGAPLTSPGAKVATAHDLLRLPADGEGKAPAILGDKRNDENRLVAQVQSLFITFHNRVIDDQPLIESFDGDFSDDTSRFRTAVMIVRWHYQWLVLHDFLTRVLEPGAVDEVLGKAGQPPKIDAYQKPDARYAYIPVEFAGAAYRFGHSMVRPAYSLNAEVGADARKPAIEDEAKTTQPPRIKIFSRDAKAIDNLNGFGVPLPNDWGIDWSFFLDGLDRTAPAGFNVPQLSYRIDAQLVDPLADLPEFFGKLSPFGNLAYRNLARGVANLRLPSGEQVAHAFGLTPLTPDVLWSAGSKSLDITKLSEDAKGDLDDTNARRAKVKAAFVDNGGELKGATPLWYYILRESEYYGIGRVAEGATEGFGGQFLGPTGSRIVAQTFVGILWADANSYLHRRPNFTPAPPIAKHGAFTLSALFAFAISAPPPPKA